MRGRRSGTILILTSAMALLCVFAITVLVTKSDDAIAPARLASHGRGGRFPDAPHSLARPAANTSNLAGSEYGGYWNGSSSFVSPEQMKAWADEVAPWSTTYAANPQNAGEPTPGKRARAVIVALVRNSELDDMVHSIKSLESSFNSRYNYPYVFLNDVPFTQEFMDTVSNFTSSETSFGLLPKDHWEIPEWIDGAEAEIARNRMASHGVMYGGSLPYRKMCRFNSGFFYKHPLLQPYDWYWRIEPDVDYYCNLDFDPFRFMEDNGKKYSFTIALTELPRTIYNMWAYTIKYARENQINTTLLPYFANANGDYNLCHFWSNFEIASLEFFRSDEYESFFQYLDSSGNFFYERYGDAPVHSLAAGLLLRQDEVHYFWDIGYRHDNFFNCPLKTPEGKQHDKCSCPETVNGRRRVEKPCLGWWKDYKPKTWSVQDYDRILEHLSKSSSYPLFEVGSVGERRKFLHYLMQR
ncbi:hypothetical protein EV182_000746 [Spiromyces aspiralis]|uniref:Uncharacterized protein n=1 Tax=Spiromyces aspiralis TaxID=68401 RepID=A0ACC1HGL9_9FUNG|nr:hypothetical protein EV182_000746 [Spiromyces aspiralis]